MSITKQNPYEIELFEIPVKNRQIYSKKISDLKPINNLKGIFRDIRDYFAGNVTGITRDEKIAQNTMRILFCKIYDEKNNKGLVEFCNKPKEEIGIFYSRINQLFSRVKKDYSDIFESAEALEVGPEDLSFIVSKLEEYSILNADRDVIADAFEELIGTAFRGGEGQFFTPRNVVQMMIDILRPTANERIIDPACGSGGFLAYTLRYLQRSKEKGYFLAGLDKDLFLSKIAKIYLSILGDEEYHIFCENSLELPKKWTKNTTSNIQLGTFDVVLTNPPFGAKIPVVGEDLLSQYDLGHEWEEANGKLQLTKRLFEKQPPQILFIERCLQLLKEGGRLGIVLPEGLFGNASDKYVWEGIAKYASVIGVVSLAQETFQPSTHTKTTVLFLRKTTKNPKSIFMAIAKAIGHNKNGKPIYKINKDGSSILDKNNNQILDDDVPSIAENFSVFLTDKLSNESHLGFSIKYKELNDHILIPEYYNPEIRKELKDLESSGKYNLITVGELCDRNIIKIKRGNEIGSQYYGTGDVPFVRTSDIVNWEIKVDPIKAVAEEIYDQYKKSQDIQEGDILFVNDGTFLIGRNAIITGMDIKIIIQSHLRKIRVIDKDFINPYYLFYLLNSKIVRRQIDAKTFVQATISTIGNRLLEVVLPVKKDIKAVDLVTKEIKTIIEEKAKLRHRTMKIIE